ncbi:MAG: proprotein convertase P-domain-containing protein, partial [Verrucomicrobiota bacterium]
GWNAANSHLPPVNSSEVNIWLSFDDGQTFDYQLAANTPNDGSHTVMLPTIMTTQARALVESADNIFFDLGNNNFTITPDPEEPWLIDAGSGHVINDRFGTGNDNGIIESDEQGIRLFLNIMNSTALGTNDATNITARLVSLTDTFTLTVDSAGYPALAGGASSFSLSAFEGNVSFFHPCGEPIRLRMDLTVNEKPGVIFFSLPTGATSPPIPTSFTPGINIPDAGSIDIALPVFLSGIISDLDFRFDGTVCSSDETSPLVGLNHSWVGDLVITLISPQGTAVRLMNRPGNGSSGNNFCQTVLDDESAGSLIDDLDSGGNDQPHVGSWRPNQPLSAFNGEQANGTWTLRIVDSFAEDVGRLNACSLIISFAACTPSALPSFFTMTGSVVGEGTIQPDGPALVANGVNTNAFVMANTFYHISQVRTNGTPIPQMFGPGSVNYSHPFMNVSSDIDIQAFFAPNLATNSVPEWWLAQNGFTNTDFNTEALTDHDGDGTPAWQEYGAATDPTDSNSVFELVSIVESNDQNVITWRSENTKLYNIWRSTNIAVQGFSLLATDLPATPPTNTWIDASPPFKHANYFIEVQR